MNKSELFLLEIIQMPAKGMLMLKPRESTRKKGNKLGELFGAPGFDTLIENRDVIMLDITEHHARLYRLDKKCKIINNQQIIFWFNNTENFYGECSYTGRSITAFLDRDHNIGDLLFLNVSSIKFDDITTLNVPTDETGDGKERRWAARFMFKKVVS
jgi:hypothetical protein